ncbi:hypothetical protein L581_4504 [Serratia fonticola AU-AP2C]|nr:hypothetical protein L581_4504 [Serratia fonticola AU-AP2C]
MKKSKINEKLRNECIERYLEKNDSSHFSAPEYYSPLYRTLYDHLIEGQNPPFYGARIQDFDDQLEKDILLCNTSFDRYLVLLYPSRYEASNPLPLSPSDLNVESLVDYLHNQYGKTANNRDSYNYDREVKKILSLIQIEKATHLKDQAKSGLYKLLVLSYKLSSINNRWKDLIQYIEPELSNKASMDNIVDFNMLELDKARENSAIIKMFYFELDRGKKDGDDTESRRIMIIPFAYDLLFKLLQNKAYQLFYTYSDLNSIKLYFDYLISRFDKLLLVGNNIHYTDKNQELFDLLQLTVLKNIYSNGLLARKKFEEKLERYDCRIKNLNNWIVDCKSNTSDIPQLVEVELGLSEGEFNQRWLSLADTLAKIVIKTGHIPPEEQHVFRNIGCILIARFNLLETVQLKSKIQGEKHNEYDIMKELERAHEWLMKNDPNIESKHHLSLMRPTSIHFFIYIFGKSIWNMDCIELRKFNKNFINSDYHHFRDILFDTISDIISKLRYIDHISCLSVLDVFFGEILHEPFSIDQKFIRSIGNEIAIYNHKVRKYIYWSPLDKKN